MKIIFTILFLPVSFLCKAQSTTLVISEIYGGGGLPGATYKNDYIVIYNLSSAAIDLKGYSLQIPKENTTTWNVFNLSGLIQPYHWFLLKGESDGSSGADVPLADATDNFNINTDYGKIALVNSSTGINTACAPFSENVIDFVGYGSKTDCSETANAPAHTKNSATARSNLAKDEDNNEDDFYAFPPNPKNSLSQALSITLSTFNVNKSNNYNRVHWQVNCLSTSVTFEVQRSASIDGFNAIYSVTETKARCAQPFDFNDYQPGNGSNYYRLKIIDIDGSVSYSKIGLSVNADKNEQVKITPNVVTTYAEVHYFSPKEENIQLLVTDMQGKFVKKLSIPVAIGDNKILVQTSELSKGLYQIKILGTTSANSLFKRFIKE